ncbi:exocyst complex component EXO70E2-like [Magnolia sinica]|uniref:exocyst complex component EXO70E2-like n=1 Tax=Magnolia sinica TaxID=86752 RepID=UPI00265A0C1E|nr:exocyst complex component EXO70E2-like [Magnolia sinica]
MDSSELKSLGDVHEDEQVIAIAQQIVKALGTSKNPTDDMIRFLSDFKLRLSTSSTSEILGKKRGISEIEERINSVEEKVMNWCSDRSMIWDRGPDESREFLRTVDEIGQLIESLGCSSLNEVQERDDLLRRAHNVLQMTMSRLEEEFSHILLENKQALEPEHLSFRSSDDDMSFFDSTSSVDDESIEDMQVRLQRDNSKGSEEFIIDLICPNVIPDLKCIAEVMFVSNYDAECCQAYISIRKDALEECLLVLEVEKLSIEEVLQMEWSLLHSKIKEWIRVMKIFVRVYLASEKSLSEQIFGAFGSVSRSCFIDSSKGLMLQLLSFGQAIAIRPHSPEKIFRLLNMYDGLADLLPDIDALFSEEAGSSVRTESHEVLSRLGDSVRRTFLEFRNAVRRNESTTPFSGGGVHHLTRYVMNYAKALTDYDDTLNFLLEENGEDRSWWLSNMNAIIQEDDEWRSPSNFSPIARCLQLVMSILESNLERKSMLYRDVSLQHFFLMNNICYMVQKVKDSNLGAFLGDNWIRKHNGKFQQHAMNYERASLSLILSFLRDEGICNPKSGSVSKAVLKERFQGFNLALEEIYKTQTAWLVHNLQLRDDLRISISLKVLQAYRTFMGRYSNHLIDEKHGDRYIKYSVEDLQQYLLDLFEGSPRSLHKSNRW